MTRAQHAKKVLSYLEDALGGEGWDHPELLTIVMAWVDLTVAPSVDAENLISNDSFDPRDLVEYADDDGEIGAAEDDPPGRNR